MAMCPYAVPKLIQHNFSKTGMSQSPRGLVVHIADSPTLIGIYSWFNNPNQTYKEKGVVKHLKASAHFAVDKDGTMWQFVDTAHQAFGMGGYNSNQNWISVENVGYHGQELTDSQIETLGNLFSWLSSLHNIPLGLASSSADKGLAYHSIDPSWGHPLCPSQPIIDQLPRIVEFAMLGY